jgi:prepilin signal peptidase PulO-like enzyme (type II secretory pathway)
MQKGKTRCCRKKLPVTYPIVELLMGILFVVYESKFVVYESNILVWVLGLIIITLLIFSAVFDFKYMILPDFSTVILILIALLGVIFDEKNIVPYLLTAIGVAGFLLFLHVITKGKGMGMGDVKYALFMGLLLGPEKTILAFYVAFVMGAIVGLILIAVRKMGRKSIIPFGPFLILGTFLAWWWGNEIGAIILKVLE